MEVFISEMEFLYFSAGFKAICYKDRPKLHKDYRKIRLMSKEIVNTLRPGTYVIQKVV